jgi:monoamine oxidase
VHRGHQISQIYASKAIVTLPLGVLQTGGVDFRPRPEKIFEAAARSRMGSVQRTVLQFHEPFWMNSGDAIAAQLHKLQFLYSNGNAPSVWWTSFPEDHSWLTAWTGGPRTNLLPESQTEVERHLISELAHIFGRDASVIHKLLIGSFAHNWQRDRFSLGAYSFAGVNSGKASEMMAEPVNETLYFAGEHTDVSGHLGTVHGALRSGFRTASQVLGL